MKNDAVYSFMNPQSLHNEEQFEFLFNQHFTSRVAFHQFDPFNNGYMTSFLLAMLTMAANESPNHAEDDYFVHDVLFGVVANNGGVKTISIQKRKSDGNRLMLTRNFFFESDQTKIKNRGLSASDRENLNQFFEKPMEEKLVEFSVYDLNENWTIIENCDDTTNKIVHPYMEKLTEMPQMEQNNVGDGALQFKSLKGFLKLPYGFRSLHVKSLNEIKIRLLINHINKHSGFICQISANLDCKIVIRGFIHGTLFATLPFHATNVRVSMNARNAYLTLEPNIHLRDIRQFTRPIWVNLAGDKQPQNIDLDIMEKLLSMAQHLLHATSDELEQRKEQILLYIAQQLDLISSSDFVHKNSIHLKAYFLGMFTSKQSNKIQYDVYFPEKESISELIIQVIGKFIVVFNFDKPKEPNTTSRKLGQFGNELKSMGAIIITVIEKISHCNPKIIREVIHHHDVTIEIHTKEKHLVEHSNTKYYRQHLKIDVVHNMVSLHTQNGDAHEILYPHLPHWFTTGGKIYETSEHGFRYFIQGTFHNPRLLLPGVSKVDRFYSRAAYTVRFESLRRITQINFFSIKFIEQYKSYIEMNAIKKGPSNYRIFNIFYEYNKTSNNFVIFAKQGNDFEDGSFQRIGSSPSFGNKECSKSYVKAHQHTLPIANNAILPEVYRIYFIAMDENAQSSNMMKSVDLKLNISNERWRTMEFDTSLSEWGLLTDNLEDPFYLLSEFINEIVDEIESIPGIKFPGAENRLAWKMAQLEITWLKTATATISKVGGKILPMIAIALDAPLLYSSVRDIINGDANARTIFNTATATVGISMSLLTTDIATKAILTIFPNILGPIWWTILAVGVATYSTNHVWDVYEEMNGLQKLVKFDALEYTFEFFRKVFFMGGSSYVIVVEHEKKVNNIRLEYGIELLEKNKNIQNFISSASCYDADNAVYTTCKSVFIDLREKFTSSASIDKADPDIPNNHTEHYESLCHMAKSYKHQSASKVLNMFTSFFKFLFSSKDAQSKRNPSFRCIEAFGINRKHTTPEILSAAHQISFYLLIGSCYVYGLNNTFNIFSLSNGQNCTLYGGSKGNRFQFSTVFKNCSIDGYGRAGNSIDFSQLDAEDNFNIVAEENNIIKFIDNDESTVLGKVHMNNIDTVIFGRPNNSDFFEATCFLDTVRIYCDESLSDVQHELYIPYKKHCNYSMQVKVNGKALISNEATFGQFVYTSHKLKGNISLNLKGSEHASHVYVASFADINSIEDFIFNQNSNSINVKMLFSNFEISITITEPKTLQITFTENIKFHYDNGLYHMVIFHPETKGQLWTRYRLALELFSRRRIPVRAYSERDQETFSFHDGKIKIDDVEMTYSMPSNDQYWAQEPQFECNEGYSVIVFHPFCYSSQAPKVESVSEELLTCFSSAVINIEHKFDVLILDMTLLTHYMNRKNKYYNITIESEVSRDTLILKFIGCRLHNDKYHYSWNIGNITLKNIMKDNQYKKLKIMAKSDFILAPNDHGKIDVTPLPKGVCPFSHLVVLDHHVIEKGQTFLFNDRMPTAFDLIKVQSSLVITNLAHKITESLVRVDPSITLSTIIVKNFFDDTKMQTLKLKFGTEGYQIDLAQWESLPIVSYHAWKEKLEVMNDYLNDDAFLMRYDSRFGTGVEFMDLAT